MTDRIERLSQLIEKLQSYYEFHGDIKVNVGEERDGEVDYGPIGEIAVLGTPGRTDENELVIFDKWSDI